MDSLLPRRGLSNENKQTFEILETICQKLWIISESCPYPSVILIFVVVRSLNQSTCSLFNWMIHFFLVLQFKSKYFNMLRKFPELFIVDNYTCYQCWEYQFAKSSFRTHSASEFGKAITRKISFSEYSPKFTPKLNFSRMFTLKLNFSSKFRFSYTLSVQTSNANNGTFSVSCAPMFVYHA